MWKSSFLTSAILILAAVGGCGDGGEAGVVDGGERAAAVIGPPGDLVTITFGGDTLTASPHTESNFDPPPADPINLIFSGRGTPRNVRDALLALDGRREAPFSSFTCTWRDAVGRPQTAYSSTDGWAASVLQLQCGGYAPIRFHVRLFPAGNWTLGNAHFEVLIPGTPEHQVLSWELGEQLIAYDLQRGGFVAGAAGGTGGINAAPLFGEIREVIFNGLPPELRSIAGGPTTGNVSRPVGIQSDGRATILPILEAPDAAGSSSDTTITFGAIIPKPFCDAGGELYRIDGPIHLRQSVRIEPGGEIASSTVLEAAVTARAFAGGQLGTAAPAGFTERYEIGSDSAGHSLLSTAEHFLELPGNRQTLSERLAVRWQGDTGYSRTEGCTP